MDAFDAFSRAFIIAAVALFGGTWLLAVATHVPVAAERCAVTMICEQPEHNN